MILTIGMIVKNEEKYLEQCLNGIKPILEQVDSELIIADTGSTDRTVEIARQFTDNVFYFEWIKDFAAARNSTLEKAQGEWFMFVDADEIFESCDEIIRFFNSGEYRKYNSGSYIVRSLLTNVSSVRYSDFRPIRLTKILPDTKFIKPIHECFNTSGQPLKNFNDYVIHHGYNAETEEERRNKFERNAELLLSRYNNNEISGLLYLQLYETFAKFEPEKADEFLDEGIEYSLKHNEPTLPILYAKKAVSLYSDEKAFEKVLEVCKEYFEMPKIVCSDKISTDIDIIAVEALALSRLDRHDEAIKKFLVFFDLYNEFEKGRFYTSELYYSSLSLARADNFLSILQNFVFSCMEIKRYSLAAEYMKKLPLDKYCMNAEITKASVYQAIDLLYRLEYSEIGKFYHRFDENGKEVFRNALFNKLFKARDASPILDFFEKEDDCENLRDPARRIYSIVSRRREGDYKNCISEMRQLIEAYPSLSSVISAYQKEVIAEYENSKPQNEMQQLAAMIKSNIRNYISSGNLTAAEKTLSEYEKINPNDSDIAELKAQIQ